MNPTQGLFNRLLIWLGCPNIDWFGDPRYEDRPGFARAIRRRSGGNHLSRRAQGHPVTLYDAASLDGAGVWRRFLNVTLPLMTPVILYDIIIGLSLGLQIFTQVYIVSHPPGGPANSTLVYVLYLYATLRYSKMGYAAALALILFVITFSSPCSIFRSSKRWVHYDTQNGQG